MTSGHAYHGPENRRIVKNEDAQTELNRVCRLVAAGQEYSCREKSLCTWEIVKGTRSNGRVIGIVKAVRRKDRTTIEWEFAK